LLGERKSAIDRYYYSAFDHAVNPSWSPDGATIFFVGNPEIAWGTGDVWSVPEATRASGRGYSVKRHHGARVPKSRPTESACSTAATGGSRCTSSG
jgi:Tol biopolymer transport system component